MTQIEILHAMVQELRNRGLIVKQKDVAVAIGTSAASLSAAMHGNPNSLTRNLLFRINTAYGIFNPSWVSTGEGPMLYEDVKQEAPEPEKPPHPLVDASSHHNADHGSTVIDGAADVGLQVQNRLLQASVSSLQKDVARLEAEKVKLEKQVAELQQGLLSALNNK